MRGGRNVGRALASGIGTNPVALRSSIYEAIRRPEKYLAFFCADCGHDEAQSAKLFSSPFQMRSIVEESAALRLAYCTRYAASTRSVVFSRRRATIPRACQSARCCHRMKRSGRELGAWCMLPESTTEAGDKRVGEDEDEDDEDDEDDDNYDPRTLRFETSMR